MAWLLAITIYVIVFAAGVWIVQRAFKRIYKDQQERFNELTGDIKKFENFLNE